MLTAYVVTYLNQSTEKTHESNISMAAGVTLEQARQYFVGKVFVDEVWDGEKFVEVGFKAIAVKAGGE